MAGGEQILLVILITFVSGVALGRFWTHIKGRGASERRSHGTASIHYILGLDLLASRQIDRAVTELTMAARKDTDAIEIYLILGNLLREKGQIERAIQIHQGVLHRPGLSKEERAHTLLCLGMDFKRAGFRNRALDTLREVIALEPDNAHALGSLGKIYEEDHDWEAALKMQSRLSEVTGEPDPTLTAFLHDRVGQDAAEAGDDKRAARAFEEAIRSESRLPPPHLHLGDLLERQQQLERAESTWLAFASDNPRLAHLVFERLERLRSAAGRNDEMEDFYRDVIDGDEKDWRARLALTRFRRNRGADDDSFQLLMDAVHNSPHSLAVHLEVWRSLISSEGGVARMRGYLDEVAKSAFFIDPYICMNCNYRTNGVLWRCPHCQEWNSFVEERVETAEES